MKEFLLYSEVNIICIAVLAIIAFNIKHSEYSPGRRPQTMLKLIYSTIGFYVLDIMGGYVRLNAPDPSPLVIYILSASYFLLFAISSYIWFFYSEILHNKAFFDNRKKHLALAIPLFVMAVMLVISYFNGCVFSVDDKRGYFRGSLFAVQPIIAFSYILAAGLRTAHFAKENEKASNYRDLVTFSTYSFTMLLCGILQFTIGVFPIMIIGETVSILLLYLHYLRNMISLDPLTQIPNRRKLIFHTQEAIKLLKQGETLYFMFVDVDNFKQINDKYGHIEGDRILEFISGTIRRFSKKNDCLCGRYGGDEFAIVQTVRGRSEFNSPSHICEMLEEGTALSEITVPFSVSIGYTKFEQGDDISDLVSRADKSMYEVKRTKKIGGGTTCPSAEIKNE